MIRAEHGPFYPVIKAALPADTSGAVVQLIYEYTDDVIAIESLRDCVGSMIYPPYTCEEASVQVALAALEHIPVVRLNDVARPFTFSILANSDSDPEHAVSRMEARMIGCSISEVAASEIAALEIAASEVAAPFAHIHFSEVNKLLGNVFKIFTKIQIVVNTHFWCRICEDSRPYKVVYEWSELLKQHPNLKQHIVVDQKADSLKAMRRQDKEQEQERREQGRVADFIQEEVTAHLTPYASGKIRPENEDKNRACLIEALYPKFQRAFPDLQMTKKEVEEAAFEAYCNQAAKLLNIKMYESKPLLKIYTNLHILACQICVD